MDVASRPARRTLLAALLPAVCAGALTGCPAEPTKKPVKAPAPVVGSQPLRRLTQEQLNLTLRDLFAGIDLPFVALNDGDTGARGGVFEGDVSRQTPTDLAVEQLRSGSIAVSKAVVEQKDVLLAGDDAHAMIEKLLPRAFRRPATQREVEVFTGFYDDELAQNDANDDVALELVLQAIIQSPSFVYRVEAGDDPYAIASRLSYLLWSTMPDDVLFAAAAADELKTPDQLEAQARRMFDDSRAHDAVLSFHRQWLDLDKVLATNKDAATFPEWNDDLRQSMRTEADKMIEEVVFGTGDKKLRTLLTTTKTRVDASLAAVYGIPAPQNDWDLVDLPADQRAGIVTDAAFLASAAHQVYGSPVLRGVFVLDRFLCEAPPPPPPNVNTNPPDPSDDGAPATNRERFSEHVINPSCASCHASIDGVGFGLEGYDAVGRFRTEDNGFPVDDSGTVDGVDFHGGPGLAALLADSSGVRDCVARHWLTFARGRAEEADDGQTIDQVQKAFDKADGDIEELLVSIVRTPAFRTLPEVTQ